MRLILAAAALGLLSGCLGEWCDDGETFSKEAQRCVPKSTLEDDLASASSDASAPDVPEADASMPDSAPDDCQGVVDQCGICEGPGATTYYKDEDGDGKGDPSNPVDACSPQPGYVLNPDDEWPSCARPWASTDCKAGQRRCAGDTSSSRQVCVADPGWPGCFDWEDEEQCGEEAPLCIGEGACSICDDDRQCTHFPDAPHCGASGSCVECGVATEAQDCGVDNMCADVGRCLVGRAGSAKTCTDTTMRELVLGPTETLGCQDDRQCAPGLVCARLGSSTSQLPEGTCLPLQGSEGQSCARGFQGGLRTDVRGAERSVCFPRSASCDEAARYGQNCNSDSPLCVTPEGGGDRIWTIECTTANDCFGDGDTVCDVLGSGLCLL